MSFLGKWWYIYQKKKELNKNYSALSFLAELKSRLIFIVEKNVWYKFVLTLSTIFLFIIISNYIAHLQIQFPDIDLSRVQNITVVKYLQSQLQYINFAKYFTTIIVQYLQLNPPDTDSARYFYSTVVQSLAALLAISFSVLLIYLQIGTDKYAIQTIRHTFSNFWAIIVISIFSITMIYSLFELCLIKNGSESVTPYYNIPSLIVIFILTIMCIVIMIKFFYVILNTLSPESFIKENCSQIKKSLWLTLLFFQDQVIYYQYLKEQIKKNENIELDSFFPSSDSQNPIRPIKYGLIRDIEIKKLNKCSQLLRKVSSDCRLKIYIPSDWQIKNKKFLLGNVDCSDNETVTEIEKLVQNAYYISNSTCILDEQTNFSPISSFTTKMIKSSERDISDKALNEFIDVALEYIKYCNELGLVEDISKMDEVALRFSFLNEFFKSLQRISKVAVDESDFETIDFILYKVKEIGLKAINALDIRSYIELINFYSWFAYKFGDKFIDKIFSETDDLSFQVYFDLKDEKEDIKTVREYEKLLEIAIIHEFDFANILINQQSKQSRRSLYKLLRMRRDLDDFLYDRDKHKLELQLAQLAENSDERQTALKKIEVVNQKEDLSIKLQSLLDNKMYMLGMYLMLHFEKNKFTVGFVQSNLSLIADYFNSNNLDETFNKINNKLVTTMDIDQGEDEIEDYQAHLIENNHYERFFILLKSLIYKRHTLVEKDLDLNIYTQSKIRIFKKELEKLHDEADLWDQLFDDNSKHFFSIVFEKMKEWGLDQEKKLEDEIIKSELSQYKAEKLGSEIISSAEKTSEARRYIKIKKTNDSKGTIPIGINTQIQKIALVDDSINPTTHYDYILAGNIIGGEIGKEESNYVIKEIYTALNIANKRLELESISFEELNIAKRELERKKFKPTTIIASSDLKLRYILHKLSIEQDSLKDRYDWLSEVEIYTSGILPEGILVLFDNEHIGYLKIFEGLKPITDKINKNAIIKKELQDGKIVTDQIEEREKELDLMVNIRAFEKVKFEFGNPGAGIVVTIKDTSS